MKMTRIEHHPYSAIILTLVLATNSQAVLAEDCLSAAALETLTRNETQYMVNRGLPTFRHALEDGKIHLAIINDATAGACVAKIDMTLPQTDIDTANRMLDSNPAKRIMLTQQGYVLPESGELHASFNVDTATLKVAHQDTLAVSGLGKLRASVEMIYALLTQDAANVISGSRNDKPWSSALRNRQINSCTRQTVANGTQEAACTCLAEGLAAQISERQMENIEYLHSDPYAFATGALRSYRLLEDNVLSTCGLHRK